MQDLIQFLCGILQTNINMLICEAKKNAEILQEVISELIKTFEKENKVTITGISVLQEEAYLHNRIEPIVIKDVKLIIEL